MKKYDSPSLLRKKKYKKYRPFFLERAANWSGPYLIEFDLNLIDRAAAAVTRVKKKNGKTKRDQ